MTVRPYEEKDKENVRFICLNSDGPCDLSPNGKNFILTTYCDYYIEKEGENCFVAVDENDNAIAYVICTEDFDAFHKVFLDEYVTRFNADESYRRAEAIDSVEPQERYKNDYPAHLHIDVLPEYQRMGLGHKMVDALCNHLRQKGIKGVMLTVGADNKKGRGFYEKYGFTLLEIEGTTAAYGLKL